MPFKEGEVYRCPDAECGCEYQLGRIETNACSESVVPAILL